MGLVQHARLSDDELDRLLMIRHFELKVLALFAEGHLGGTTHTCLGQEHVPVAMTQITAPAFTFSNHRGHGHYLAQFGDADGLLAEITGRQGAVCGGMGGSQHILRRGYCSTGVQGQGVAAALGVALHMRSTGRDEIAVAYLGDGTWGQGVVYEALNMAVLWQVPLVLVVENNGIAQTTPTERAMAGTVEGRARAFGARYQYVDSTCVPAIREQLVEPVSLTRAGAGPLVVEFRVDRLGPHSKGDDTRPADVVADLRTRDWYVTYAASHPDQFHRCDTRQRAAIDELAREVLARPLVAADRELVGLGRR